MDDLTPDASCSIIWTQRPSLPSVTTLSAICNDPHCHLQRPSLPSSTTLTVICNDPHCHLQRPSLPSATTLTAICNDPHCHPQRPSLPSATTLSAICKGIYQYWINASSAIPISQSLKPSANIRLMLVYRPSSHRNPTSVSVGSTEH